MRQRPVSDLCATVTAVRQSNALILGLRNGQPIHDSDSEWKADSLFVQ